MAYLNARLFQDLSYLPKPNNNNTNKKQRKGSGIVNTLIDALPFQLHWPGYSYLGPGTKLERNLQEGVKPVNPLDAAALEHDKAYRNTTDTTERSKSDKILENKAWNRVLSSDSGLGEKAAAWVTTNAMKLKGLLGQGLAQRNGGVIRRRRRRKLKQRSAMRKVQGGGGGNRSTQTRGCRRRRRGCGMVILKKVPQGGGVKKQKPKKKRQQRGSGLKKVVQQRRRQRQQKQRGRGMVIMKKQQRGNGLMEAFLKCRRQQQKKKRK